MDADQNLIKNILKDLAYCKEKNKIPTLVHNLTPRKRTTIFNSCGRITYPFKGIVFCIRLIVRRDSLCRW